MMHRRTFIKANTGIALAAALVGISGCTSTGPSASQDPAARRAELDAGVQGALNRLYESVPSARELGSRAQGILVFPRVLGAGFIVGGESGDGALLAKGGTSGYFRTTSASFGATAGAQSRSIIIMLMTQAAYDSFVASSTWTIGADASVAVAKIGANGTIDTFTARQPIIAFSQTNAGLMVDVSLNGARIRRLDL